MLQNKLTVLGVTGITGSGTSTVAAILAERGGFIIQADKLAHELMAKLEPAYNEILSAFGTGILNENGEINRRALGTKVFGNKANLETLERIIHPRVIERTNKIIDKISNLGGHTFAVIDAPLLVESGLHKICDSVWLIIAPDALRLSRIVLRDNIDENAATRRLQSRSGDEPLREHANIVIQNDGSPIALRSKIETALKAMSLRKFGWVGLPLLEI